MNKFRSRLAVSIAALATFAVTAAPALARGHGDRGRHHHHHRDRIDGGDVLAGLLIIGGIAAIASAASKSSKNREADDRYRYPGGPDYGEDDDRGYGEDRGARYGAPGTGAPGGFDEAVDRCADEVEDGERRIATIDNVGRVGGRYSVDGHLDDGRVFACSVDDEGRVRSVAVDGRAGY
jgi:hypothetical protein